MVFLHEEPRKREAGAPIILNMPERWKLCHAAPPSCPNGYPRERVHRLLPRRIPIGIAAIGLTRPAGFFYNTSTSSCATRWSALGGIAQWVERMTGSHEACGSIPHTSTNGIKDLRRSRKSFFRFRRANVTKMLQSIITTRGAPERKPGTTALFSISAPSPGFAPNRPFF